MTTLIADWNASPTDRGRWAPAWVAAQAGLRFVHSGPGRHGNIDYALTDDSRTSSTAQRHAPPEGLSRSDHDVVTYRVGQLRVGQWNLLYGRPPGVVAAQVLAVLEAYHLDVLAVNEAADYHQQLAALPHYRLIAFNGPGQGHNAMLIRENAVTRKMQLWRLSPRGWRLVTGGTHRELYGVSADVDGHHLVVLHMPPSVNWTRGRIRGPVLRVAAYAAASRRLVRRVRDRV